MTVPRDSLNHCFSTLGCADLTFPEICSLAGEFGIRGLELRGIGSRMDMPEYCAEQKLTRERIADLCRTHNTQIIVVGSSLKLTSATAKDRADLLSFCVWAESLEARYIRVFGGGTWGKTLRAADYRNAAELVRWWRNERKSRGWKLELLLETHDAFSGTAPCLELNRLLEEPLALIWDSHHTWRIGGESLEETWAKLGPFVRHVHFKDSVNRPSARHPYTYVLPGDGEMPLSDLFNLLRREAFSGFVSLEWERHWHPYLPPLRTALERLQQRKWFVSSGSRATAPATGAAAVGAGAARSAGSYESWQEAAEGLLKPLAALMQPGKADLPIAGASSNHGSQADRLESFARPCLLAAHWLASEKAKGLLSRDTIAEWFRNGLLIGTDPSSPEYWGPTANHHQHTVEMAALTLAFQIARPQLWEPLSKRERLQVAQWLASVRGAGLHRNNHMFFCVLPLAFLEQEGWGRPADKQVMRYLMDVLEGMALGGGWFLDGMNETVDYYAAYAWAYYGVWWAKLYGHADPARASRWKDWAAAFLKDYAHFFAASGENPPFGRSICYRFAASAPFALAEHCGIRAIPPGQARGVCTTNLRFFLQQPIEQKQGALSLGWTDEFPPVCEAYSCAGSPYWAAKGFAPLLLPKDHPFWTEPEQPPPAALGNFDRLIPQSGLAVRSHNGAVEVLNNANGICVGNLKFGPWKWGKLSYRSGYGFEVARDEKHYPLDASLTAQFESGDDDVYGRHQCQPVAVEAGHCASVYGLGDRFSQNHVSVESHIWWKGGWQLHWHHVNAHRPALLRLGTYSLPLSDTTPLERQLGDSYGIARDSERGIAIQPLSGFKNVRPHESDPEKRTHLLAWHSLVLTADTPSLQGDHDLVALVWAGAPSEEAHPWEVHESAPGQIRLRHPALGDWDVRIDGFPVIKCTEK